MLWKKKKDKQPPTEHDDFDWSTYHHHYQRELDGLEAAHTLRLQRGGFSIEQGRIRLPDGAKPLHPNHAALYQTLLSLEPASIIEGGCGGGDHLHNLTMLTPQTALTGLDRGDGQLDLLRRRNPEAAALVRRADLTMPPAETLPRADIVFTQAVIMHIQGGSAHFVALSNLIRMAERAVLLMENWSRHAFVADIKRLVEERMTPWREVSFQVARHESPGGAASVLIVAPAPVAGWPPLERYEDLTR